MTLAAQVAQSLSDSWEAFSIDFANLPGPHRVTMLRLSDPSWGTHLVWIVPYTSANTCWYHCTTTIAPVLPLSLAHVYAHTGIPTSAHADIQQAFFMAAYQLVYVCIYPTIYPFIHLSANLSINPSIHLSIYLSIHLSIYPSIHLSIHPSIHLSIYPSIYLEIYPSIHLSIYLSIYSPLSTNQ